MNIIELANLKEHVTFLEGKLANMTRAIIKLLAAVEKITDRLKVLEKEKKVESSRSTGS